MMRADKRKAGEEHGILCAQARDAGRSDRHADGAGAFGGNGAAGRAVPCGRSAWSMRAIWRGLLHDLGKYTEAFQQYLDEGDSTKRGSVIHTFQGCRYLMEQYHRGDIQTISCAELLAFAVGAHHGLFDCVDQMRRIGLQYRAEKQDISYEEAVAAFRQEIPTEEIETLFAAASEEINEVIGRMDRTYDNDREYAFETGLLARLLLSAVIEGDRCDTAAFQIDAHPRSLAGGYGSDLERSIGISGRKAAGIPMRHAVEKARHAISDQCRVFAENKPGIYRLNVPTGGGKTLSSLRYALAHAMYFRKSRLIFTSPLLSILEQNAAVIHQYVGDDSLIPGASFQRCADRACAGRAGRAGASGAKLECADHHHDTGPTAEHTVRWKNDGDPSLSGSLQQCDRY